MSGAPPLYGTCTTLIPACDLNSSYASWLELALPNEP